MRLVTRRTALASIASARSIWARGIPHQVLAFYYGWYANPSISGQWFHWPEGTAHQPALGQYDSHDPRTVELHLGQAKAAGITGLVVSWWKPGDFEDQGLPLVLDTAARVGMKVSLYCETAKPRAAPKPEETAREIVALLEKHGSHPAWLRVGARPVLFVYSRALNELGLGGWASVIAEVKTKYRGGACFIGDAISRDASKVFDGIHSYNPTEQTANLTAAEIREWARRTYPKWVAAARARISCVTVIPGYDDTRLKRPAPRPTTSRNGGETYRVLWEEAIRARPNWILITSWNEWHEGSEIEPSKEFRDRELETTKRYAREFLAG